jgi:hypothetical protein
MLFPGHSTPPAGVRHAAPWRRREPFSGPGAGRPKRFGPGIRSARSAVSAPFGARPCATSPRAKERGRSSAWRSKGSGRQHGPAPQPTGAEARTRCCGAQYDLPPFAFRLLRADFAQLEVRANQHDQPQHEHKPRWAAHPGSDRVHQAPVKNARLSFSRAPRNYLLSNSGLVRGRDPDTPSERCVPVPVHDGIVTTRLEHRILPQP